MKKYLNLNELVLNYMKAEIIYNDIKNPNYFKGVCHMNEFGEIFINSALIDEITDEIDYTKLVERKDLTEDYTPLELSDELNFEVALLNYVNNILFPDLKKIFEKYKNKILIKKGVKGVSFIDIINGMTSLHLITNNFDKFNIKNNNTSFLNVRTM